MSPPSARLLIGAVAGAIGIWLWWYSGLPWLGLLGLYFLLVSNNAGHVHR